MGTCISLPSLHRGKAGQKRGSVKSGFVGTGISKKKHEEINLEELKVGESAYNTGAYRGINRSVVNNARLSDSEDSEHRQPKNVYEQLHPQAACCSYRSNPGSVTSWVFESSGDTPKASYAPEIVPAEEHPLPETRSKYMLDIASSTMDVWSYLC